MITICINLDLWHICKFDEEIIVNKRSQLPMSLKMVAELLEKGPSMALYPKNARFLLMSTLSAFLCVMLGQPALSMGAEQTNYSDLEIQVWTASEHQLHAVEKNVVRELQMFPDDPFLYYLLAHLRLREFSKSSDDLALVKQASEMAQQAVELAPDSEFGYIALAETLDLMGQSKRGFRLLETASSAGVEPSWRIYFTMGRLSATTADEEKILGLLRQSLAFKGAEADIVVHLRRGSPT